MIITEIITEIKRYNNFLDYHIEHELLLCNHNRAIPHDYHL